VILVAGDSMQLVDASQGACELLGYERAELLALSVRDIAVDRAQLERLHTEFLRDGQQSGSVVLHRKDGSSVEAVYYGFTRRREFHVAVLFPL
jgi:PAS domain S-box-containing protein